jgi:hypothetical protein
MEQVPRYVLRGQTGVPERHDKRMFQCGDQRVFHAMLRTLVGSGETSGQVRYTAKRVNGTGVGHSGGASPTWESEPDSFMCGPF